MTVSGPNGVRGMVKKNFLYVDLANQILSYIEENQIEKGDRIPSERRLASVFSASRASVREAVRVLESQGYIEIQIGNGMYLRKDPRDQNTRIELWKVDYKELLEIKTLLEFQIVTYLCGNLTQEQSRSLEEAMVSLEADYARGVFIIEEDRVFHTRLRNMYPNKTMVQLLDRLIESLDEYGLSTAGFEGAWVSTIPYHRDLLEAMRAGDLARARVAYDKISDLDRNGLELAEQSK